MAVLIPNGDVIAEIRVMAATMAAVIARLMTGPKSDTSNEAITPPKFAPLQKLVKISEEYTDPLMTASSAPSDLALRDTDLTRK